jgi:hypothetical protein
VGAARRLGGRQVKLQPIDNDAALLADRSKLAAAARRLDGRQVKLLPDER